MQIRSLLPHPGVRASDSAPVASTLDALVPAHLETATFASG